MNMTPKEVIAYLETLPTTVALWWFIENRQDSWETEVFFYLRERVRVETDVIC
jgi:hypothetical protein